MPLSVLQVSKFYPPVEGGIESVVHGLASGLFSAKWTVAVLCANTAFRTTQENDLGYPVVRTASLGKLLSTSVSPALVSELRRAHRRFDVVHVHLPDPMATVALRLAGNIRSKVVAHWHSDIVNQKQALRLYEPLQRWLLARADVIIATSENYALSSKPLQPYLRKTSIIPIGIQDPAPPCLERVTKIRQRFGHRKIIFSLGRSVYYKGFTHLVSAAHLLPADCVILIGGQGPLKSSLKRQISETGLEEKVFLLGRLGEEQVKDYYAAADVFCLPSILRAEAFGVVLLEAMAASKPIVATNISGSGVSWVNQHGITGFNATPGDSAGLAHYIRVLLDDTALAKRMGDAARRRFDLCFRYEKMIDATKSVYIK